MQILAIPLGWIMKGCYMLVKNYGIALFLFTVITRLITLPLQIKQQKSMARTQMIQPELEKLKKKYGKNQEKLNEETMKLYSEYQINPMASCLPMAISMLILFALIPVVYGPLSYISDVGKTTVKADCTVVKNLYTISAEVDTDERNMASVIGEIEADSTDDITAELENVLSNDEKYPKSAKVLNNLTDAEKKALLAKFVEFDGLDEFVTNPDNFTQNMMNSSYGPEVLLFNFESKADGKYLGVLDSKVQAAIKDFDYTILGLELGKIPSKKDATVLIPFVSFALQLLTTIISQLFQKRNNPDMKLNGSMLMMLVLMPVFSLWIGFKFPCALGIYWIYSSLFAVFQVIFLNIVYSPAKLKVIAEKESEKARAKRKKKGPSFMERAIEVRNEQGDQMPKPNSVKKEKASEASEDSEDVEADEDVKLSKSQLKEQNRQKLNEARRRYAEKYGDEFTDE